MPSPPPRNPPNRTVFKFRVTNALGQQFLHHPFLQVLEFADLCFGLLYDFINRSEDGCDFLLFGKSWYQKP